MNLQTYIATFISFLNEIVVPFMLGMAFLIFIINVFRFFIVGGSNPDGQEKAKRLAIYGVGAFVFIIIFWGIVNLLTSSFGLQRFGETETRCFDYDPSCTDGNPTSNGGNFAGGPAQPNTNIGDPRSPDVGGGPGFPSSPGATIPSQPSTPSMPSQPSMPSSPSLPSSPQIDAPADYSDVTREAINSVEAVFPILEATLLTDQFAAIGTEQQPDSVRVNSARAFADAGLITEADFESVLAGINSVRTRDGFPPISSSFAVADPAYTADLQTYDTSVQLASDQITQWYGGGITAENEIDRLFNTQYSLDTRYQAIDAVLTGISSPDPTFNESLESAIRSALETERSYTQRPS